MISVTYRCPQHLTERAQVERVNRWRHLRNNLWHYLVRFGVVGLMILEAHRMAGSRIDPLLVAAPVLIGSVIFALVARKGWLDEVRTTAVDYDVSADLDDAGVTSWVQTKEHFAPWDRYLWYEDEPTALKLMHADGGVSFLPKSAETAEAIAFTKTKVKSRTE